MLSCQLGTPLGLTTGCTHSNDAGVNCGELYFIHFMGVGHYLKKKNP